MSEVKKNSEGRCKEPEIPYHLYDGVPFAAAYHAESLSYIRDNLSVYDDDIWLCTYPKTGTTWTQAIITLLFNDCDTKKFLKVDIDKYMPYLELSSPRTKYNGEKSPEILQGPLDPKILFSEHGYKQVEEMKRPRLIETHLPWQMLPKQVQSVKPKIIYVYRNPKDVAVSYFDFHNKTPLLRKYCEWEFFLEDFLKGDVNYGSYIDHVLEYRKAGVDYKNILFIKFEDLKKDMGKEIRKMAEFCGKPIKNEDSVKKMVEFCSFDHLKTVETFNRTKKFEKWGANECIFFNKGTSGGWKNKFTVSQNEYFDKIYKNALEGTGFSFE